MRRAGFDAAWAALLAVLAMLWFAQSWDRIIDPRDEGYLFFQAERVLAGEVTHRDFHDVYGPAALPLTALALKAVGGDVLGMHVFMGAVRAFAVGIGFLLLCCVVPRPWAVSGALLSIVWWGRFEWNLSTPYASIFTIVLEELALLLVMAGRGRGRGWPLAAGLVSGLSLLFKQSLALLGGLALALALLADGLLAEQEPPPGARASWAPLAVWLAAAVAVPATVASFLHPSDYLIHLLPIHATFALLWRATRRTTGASLARTLRASLVPWAVGAATLPLVAVVRYAAWGALGELLTDMFWLPLSHVNYAIPIERPSLPEAAVALGALGLVAAGVAALRPAPRFARRVLGAGLVLLAAGTGLARLRQLPLAQLLAALPASLEGVQLAAIGWAGIVLLGLGLRSPRSRDREAARAVVPILLFHLFLCFQLFPRAGPDLHLVQGAEAIALVLVLHRTFRGALPAAPRARRALCVGLLVAPVVALVAPVVHEVLTIPHGRKLRLPHADGIELAWGAIDQLKIDDMERLVAWLDESEPPDAPIFVLTNEYLIYYVTGRPALFADRSAELLWLGWDMLPPRRIAALDADAMAERLRAHPEALVIDNPRYIAAVRKLRGLGPVRTLIREDYELVRSIGSYRVYRLRRPETGAP